MNIFFLSANPLQAAKMSCDRHSIKMILESAQMLCTNLRLHGYDGEEYLYGSTHVTHPSTIWTGKTLANFNWVLTHAFGLCEEYTHRYGKIHKSKAILELCASLSQQYIPIGSLTVPPKCMGDKYKIGETTWEDVVSSYRNYYRNGKGYMNKGKGPQWNKLPSRKPKWFSE